MLSIEVAYLPINYSRASKHLSLSITNSHRCIIYKIQMTIHIKSNPLSNQFNMQNNCIWTRDANTKMQPTAQRNTHPVACYATIPLHCHNCSLRNGNQTILSSMRRVNKVICVVGWMVSALIIPSQITPPPWLGCLMYDYVLKLFWNESPGLTNVARFTYLWADEESLLFSS